MTVLERFFGTDGIRGAVGSYLTAELAYRLGLSLGSLGCPRVTIGRDTRESGPLLAAAVARGARDQGLDILDLGVVPTPLLSYASGLQDAVGVMITASHNPFTDNGLKVFLRGKKLFEHEEAALETVIGGTDPAPSVRPGRILTAIDPFALYAGLALPLLPKTTRRVVLDCANGATCGTAERFFTLAGADLVLTGHAPDGRNINAGVGSTHPEHLREAVRATADPEVVGFAFDGDGDRLIAAGADGRIYDGDQLVYVIACHLQARGLLAGNAVALTKMSNLGLRKALARKGIRVVETEVGDKYVLEALENGGYVLGGESSGHIIDRTVLNTGDGVLNALRILGILAERHATLAELTADVHLYPDRLENVRGVDKTLARHPEVVALAAAIAADLGDEGKVIVRASGTEPLIRVSVSAPTQERVDAAVDALVGLIRSLSR